MAASVTDIPMQERQWTPRVSTALLARLTGARRRGRGRRGRYAVEAPFTGETLGEVPAATPADVTRRRGRGARGSRSPGDSGRPPSAPPCCCAFHDLLLDNAPGRRWTSSSSRRAKRGAAPSRRCWTSPSRRATTRTPRRASCRPRRRQGALPLLTAAHGLGLSARRHRHDLRPANYPLSLTPRRRHPGAAGGQRRGAQARRADAVHRAVGRGPAGRGRPAARPAADRHRTRLPARRAAHRGYRLPRCSRAPRPTGKMVAAQAAARLKDCAMELGGKNPLLALPDAGLSAAGAGRSARHHRRQWPSSCVHIERLDAHDDIYDAFVSRLIEGTAATSQPGAGLDFSADMGSPVSAQQLAAATDVADAVARGAEALGGFLDPRPESRPRLLEPTLLPARNEDMAGAGRRPSVRSPPGTRCRSVDEMVARARTTPLLWPQCQRLDARDAKLGNLEASPRWLAGRLREHQRGLRCRPSPRPAPWAASRNRAWVAVDGAPASSRHGGPDRRPAAPARPFQTAAPLQA